MHIFLKIRHYQKRKKDQVMILRCQKCQSRLDKENEFCQSCGAYNPYYGLTTEEEDKLMLIESQSTVDLSKPQGDYEQLHRLSQAAHRDSKPPKNPYIKRWIRLWTLSSAL